MFVTAHALVEKFTCWTRFQEANPISSQDLSVVQAKTTLYPAAGEIPWCSSFLLPYLSLCSLSAHQLQSAGQTICGNEH
jgi:hypothetical protein